MGDETWRGIIIRSIPPTASWLPVIPSLYGLTSSADIVSMILAHGMTLDRRNQTKPSGTPSNTALAARLGAECTNPNCKAKKRSTHTTANCYWPGGGKEGQFSLNFDQRTKVNAASATRPKDSHFVLSVIVEAEPGASGVVLETVEEPATALISQGFNSFKPGKVPTFMDSGASDTMFVSRDDFVEYTPTSSRTGDSAKAKDGNFDIVGEGKVTKRYLIEGTQKAITFTRALHTPTLNANLISVSAFDRAGLTITFGGGKGIVRKPDGTIVLTSRLEKGMYVVDAVDEESGEPTTLTIALTSLSQPIGLEQWHRRLAHCSPATIQEMADRNLVDELTISDRNLHGKCEDCVLGRQMRRPFDNKTDPVLEVLELVSFDLWGPSRVQSVGGKIYFMPIVDAGSSYKHGAYLRDKSNSSTIEAFDAFRAKAESLTGKKIRRLWTDRAYESVAWEDYCRKHSILHEFTAPYSSAQNGLAERAIRTTMVDIRTLLRDSDLSHSYWAEAAAYSVDTCNLIPSRRHSGKVPLESFTGKRQLVSHLRVFGAKCWAKIPTVNGAQINGGLKLDARGVECRLLGYASSHGNYKVQDIAFRRVFTSRDVVFEEGFPHCTSPTVGGKASSLFDVLHETDTVSEEGGKPTELTSQTTDNADTTAGETPPSGSVPLTEPNTPVDVADPPDPQPSVDQHEFPSHRVPLSNHKTTNSERP